MPVTDQEKLDAAIEWLLPGHDDPSHPIILVKATRPDGPPRYKVMDGGCCLNKDGEFEYEPSPSNRDDEFLSRTRWDSFDEAWAAGIKAVAEINRRIEVARALRNTARAANQTAE